MGRVDTQRGSMLGRRRWRRWRSCRVGKKKELNVIEVALRWSERRDAGKGVGL